MKRCPECGREYNTMAFCLDDGTELLYGPASLDEPATAILPGPGAFAPSLTRPTGASEVKTSILQPPATTPPRVLIGTGCGGAEPTLPTAIIN